MLDILLTKIVFADSVKDNVLNKTASRLYIPMTRKNA